MCKIVSTAVKEGGRVHFLPDIPGAHHGQIRNKKGLSGMCGTSGFLTDEGDFVDRQEAMYLAKQAGQIKKLSDLNFGTKFGLSSEDFRDGIATF